MIVLGVDPGRTEGTGVAILHARPDWKLPRLLMSRTLKPDLVGAASAREWISEAATFGRVCERRVLAIEVSPYIKFANAIKSLWHQVGGWEWLAEDSGLGIVRVAPRAWQKYVTGTGKQPPHDVMAATQIAVASKNWPGVVFDEHRAAAALVALYVADGQHEVAQLRKDGYR